MEKAKAWDVLDSMCEVWECGTGSIKTGDGGEELEEEKTQELG